MQPPEGPKADPTDHHILKEAKRKMGSNEYIGAERTVFLPIYTPSYSKIRSLPHILVYEELV